MSPMEAVLHLRGDEVDRVLAVTVAGLGILVGVVGTPAVTGSSGTGAHTL